MNLSVGRRTWEEASSPAAVRLAQRYEQAWRDSSDSSERPVLDDYLADSSIGSDAPGTRLALLRTDMSLHWEAGQKLGVQWYLEHYSDLGEDTIVALIYEEFCLREDDHERPAPAEYLARFPQHAAALGRVLEIHELLGSGQGASLSLSSGMAGGHACERSFPEAGQNIAGFFLVEELGRGAFARVFLARERALADRLVALKVTRRGSREPQTLARLQHTHIVPVHSHRIDAPTGLHLLCMPYFGRITLAKVLADPEVQIADSGAALADALDRLDRLEALPDDLSAGRAALLRRSYPQAIAWWGARLAEALDHAHDRGVLHRDIKPSNVLVTCDGMPMLLDFNLAREPVLEDGTAAAPTTLGGTIDYMAPEHLQALAEGCADRVDGRADIYGLGMVLFEALTGNRPFDSPRKGASVMEALLRAAEERRRSVPPVRALRPEIPPALEAVLMHCLEPNVEDRYQRSADLALDLEAVADDQPLLHAREPWPSRAAGWLRRRRQHLAIAGAVLLALVAVLSALLFITVQRRDDEDLVRRELHRGLELFDRGEFENAKIHFEAVEPLGGRFERGFWQRLTRKQSFPEFGAKLAGWLFQPPLDLEETKHQARIKAELAELNISARRDAQAFLEAAGGLKFRLLLPQGDDAREAVLDLKKVLEPFYVLKARDWAVVDEKMRRPLTLLEPEEREKVKSEVNELLFLWATAIDESLALASDAADKSAPGTPANAIEKAIELCDWALCFAQPPEPWLALRARLIFRRAPGSADPASAGTGARAALYHEPRSPADEKSALACFQWGLLYFRNKSFGRASDWLQRAVTNNAGNYWYQFFLAMLKDRQELRDEALLHYGAAVALEPDSPWILFNRARLYRAKGWWDRAIHDMQGALRAFGARARAGVDLTPRSEVARVHLELGYLYQMLGDFPRARAEYKDVIALDPKNLVAPAARLDQANIDAESGAFGKALKEYGALLELDKEDFAARHNRALLELQLGQAAPALRDLSTLLAPGAKIKNRDEILAARALAHLLLGHPEAAIADARDARRLRPSPPNERLVQRALLAARSLDGLHLDRPEDIALLPLGGQRLLADLSAASAGLAELARTNPEEAFRASLIRAVVLSALGEHDAAESAATRALALSPYSAEALLIRARIRSFRGDRRQAWEDVQRGLAVHEADPRLLELRGALRSQSGDQRGALEDYNEAINQGAPDRIHLQKAVALAKSPLTSDLALAVDEWSLALRADPELPEAYLGRAQAHIRLQHWNSALADLEQAASWAHSAPAVELKIVWAYLQCVKDRRDRLPRWLDLARRAARDLWGALTERPPKTFVQASNSR
jgi:serine/threonine protein kinase/Tfp pilus assembly protein PilF